MPLVVPGVCQYTINGTYGDRPVANVLAYQIDTTGTPTERANALNAMAGIIINQWTTLILAILNSAYTAQNVSWIDLNAADGNIGSRTSSGGNTWPKAGSAVNATMPGNVAILVRKNVGAKRGARKGRIFVPGVDETMTQNPANNTLYSANLAQLVTAFNSFLTTTNQTSVPDNYTSKMNVIHVLTRDTPKKPGRLGAPLTGEGLVVSSLTVDQRLATQRRRLRG